MDKFTSYMSFQPRKIFEFSWEISPISNRISHFSMNAKVKLSLIDKSRLLITKDLKDVVLQRLNSQWLMCQVYPLTKVYCWGYWEYYISIIYNVMYFVQNFVSSQILIKYSILAILSFVWFVLKNSPKSLSHAHSSSNANEMFRILFFTLF